jgi:hypothetical protein
VFPEVERDTHHWSESPIANSCLLRNLLPSLTSKRVPRMRLWANLVVDDRLLEIFERLKHILIAWLLR